MANCWFCYKDAGTELYHKKCSKKFFGTDIVPVLNLDEDLLMQLAEKSANERIAVTGVQPKLSLTIEKEKNKDRLTIVGLWGEFILKPQHKLYSSMPETEDLTMHLASVFKIITCEHTLLQTTSNELVYIAKRFDRNKGKKIHMEDFCQLSEFLTEQKYKGSYEKAGKIILNYCLNTGLDAINYFELVLFSYLTGNNDMHLKNFSLLYHEQGVGLSPAYDLLNINLVNPKDDEELALTLNGKKKIRLEDFIVLAKALGIPEKVYQNSFKKFASKNKSVFDMIGRSFLSTEIKEKYWQIWLGKQKLFS